MTSDLKQNIPTHIGLVIDGNRRWAKKNGLPSLEGHRRGFDKVKEISKYIWEKGVEVLTIYCFSTENWNRDKKEVAYLMDLLGNALLEKNIADYHKKGIKIRIIGQKHRLNKAFQDRIKSTEELTKNNKKGTLVLAISYGGKAEIIEATKKIIEKRLKSNEITEDIFEKFLWTVGLPHPDLIIRSGGEHRLSNFLTWQSAYSELYFSSKLWPDFTSDDIDEAIADYLKRQKRFGR